MKEEANKIWQSEAGGSLFQAILKKQPLSLQDRITLRKLRKLNQDSSENPPPPTAPTPTEKP
jgi:hypothetical protein